MADTTLDNSSSLQEKLASLDSDFNTNPGFGFMGMLEKQEQALRDAQQASKEERDEHVGESKSQEPPEWFSTLNTSVQSVRGEVGGQLNRMAQELASLKSARQAEQNQDLDLPPEVAPVVDKLNQMDRGLASLALKQEYSRAKDALRDARAKYKDFSYSEDELNEVWNKHVNGNPNVAAQTRWDSYFESQFNARALPSVKAENEKLRADIEKLKNGRNSVNDLYSVPRSNRSGPVKSTSDKDFDEELYSRASKKLQKGKFLGFNRALIDEQRRMSLSA